MSGIAFVDESIAIDGTAASCMDEREYLTFRLGAHEYAIGIRRVQEICRCQQVDIDFERARDQASAATALAKQYEHLELPRVCGDPAPDP